MQILTPASSDAIFCGTQSAAENFDSPDLVLVQTPGWGLKTPPLSIASLAAYVRQSGYKVLPLDLNLEFYLLRREGYQDVWEDWKAEWYWSTPSCVDDFVAAHQEIITKHIDFLASCGAKIFGFSCYSSCINLSLIYARELKKRNPEFITVFGGPHVSRNLGGTWVASLPYVDLVAQGEGELTLLEIVERATQNKPLSGIIGTLHNDKGVVTDNGNRPLIRDLDVLPFAALGDFNFSLYREKGRLPMMASRGCPNNCNFCSEKVYWIGYRGFSAKRVADEVFFQLEGRPEIDVVEFMDSLINGVVPRMMDMAKYFISHPRKFRWIAQAVIRKEMTLDVFKTLEQSGCFCLAFGLETSSPELMLRTGKHLSKGVDIDQLVMDAHAAGMSCAYNFMFGLPGETAEDAAASLTFMRKHKDHVGAVNPSAGFCAFSPGTPAGDHPEKFGVVPDATDEGRYWETFDGKNDFLVRLERFEAFCALCLDLGVHTTYPHAQLLDRDRLIANYWFRKKDYSKALESFDRWLLANPKDPIAVTRRDTCAVQVQQGNMRHA